MSSIESRSLRIGLCLLVLLLLLLSVSSDSSADLTGNFRSVSQDNRIRRAAGAFVGMRGKKYLCSSHELCDMSSSSQDDMAEGNIDKAAFALSMEPFEEPFSSDKRFDGFAAMRGKKDSRSSEIGLSSSVDDKIADNLEMFLESKRSRSKGFLGMRGKKKPLDGDQKRGPEGKFFAAMRGKRPSNRNRDASSAFFGVRGKRSDISVKCDNFRGNRCIPAQEFVAVRGSE